MDMRIQRLNGEANDLKRRLANNGYKPLEPFDPETIPTEHQKWIARLWYIGRALIDRSLPEVP